MRIRILAPVLCLAALIGCGQGAGPRPAAVEETARQIMVVDGFGDAAITRVVQGEPDNFGADELYCVATDATTSNGELPYLLVVWRDGDTWEGQQLFEGYYDWDLQGCPR